MTSASQLKDKHERIGMSLIHIAAAIASFLVAYVCLNAIFTQMMVMSPFIFLSLCGVSYVLMVTGLLTISEAFLPKNVKKRITDLHRRIILKKD